MLLFRYVILIILTLVSLRCSEPISEEDKLHINNIQSVLKLKIESEELWPGLNNPKNAVPLVYYTDSLCYVVNPSTTFKTQFNSKLILSDNEYSYYKTMRIDTVPFHMHVGTTFDDKNNFNYLEPYMQCTSPELTSKFVPVSTEEWRTMVLHEMFHGFQLRQPVFFNMFKELDQTQTTLSELYNSHNWYAESISIENNYLLAAVNSDNPAEFVQKYLCQRNDRYNKVLSELNVDIRDVESIFETMEGTARYIEVNSCKELYDLESNSWIWNVGNGNYFYATGFNIARLLDKLEVKYKSKLFSVEKLSLFAVLTNYFETNTHTDNNV